MFFVAHVDGHLDQRAVRLGFRLRFEAADVGVFIGEHGSELGKHAGTVVGLDHDLHREGVGSAAGPFHFDFALHIVHQVLHVAADLGMHRHALAARDIANDGFAADRIATLGAIDQQIVHAFDANDRIAVRTTRHARRGRARLPAAARAPSAAPPGSGSTCPGASFCSTWRAEYLP